MAQFARSLTPTFVNLPELRKALTKSNAAYDEEDEIEPPLGHFGVSVVLDHLTCLVNHLIDHLARLARDIFDTLLNLVPFFTRLLCHFRQTFAHLPNYGLGRVIGSRSFRWIVKNAMSRVLTRHTSQTRIFTPQDFLPRSLASFAKIPIVNNNRDLIFSEYWIYKGIVH